jgi:hypothetical protein
VEVVVVHQPQARQVLVLLIGDMVMVAQEAHQALLAHP